MSPVLRSLFTLVECFCGTQRLRIAQSKGANKLGASLKHSVLVSKGSVDDGQGPRKEDRTNMLYTIVKAL